MKLKKSDREIISKLSKLYRERELSPTEHFFNQLSKLYRRKKHCAKFYCQESTFSFEIYRECSAYHGTPIFRSEIYDFWRNRSTMKQIVRDIKSTIRKLES